MNFEQNDFDAILTFLVLVRQNKEALTPEMVERLEQTAYIIIEDILS